MLRECDAVTKKTSEVLKTSEVSIEVSIDGVNISQPLSFSADKFQWAAAGDFAEDILKLRLHRREV